MSLSALFVTGLPGPGWDTLMEQRACEMVRTLRELGTAVLEVDYRALVDGASETATLVARFEPDFITAANFNYYLQAAGPHTSLLHSLQVPVGVIWDDPLGALALNWAQQRGGRLGELNLPPASGARAIFEGTMCRPNVHHFAWDTGHVRSIEALGLRPPKGVHWIPLPTYAPFIQHGQQAAEQVTYDVAFCGNLYLGALRQSAFWSEPFWRELTEEICRRKASTLETPVLDLLEQAIEALPAIQHGTRWLARGESVYWDYYLFCVWIAANTLVRLHVLQAVEHNIDLFGLFADDASKVGVSELSNVVYRGNADHFDELPDIFARTAINVCLSNGLIQQGVPSKLIDCLASGGFALCDPKDDLITLFGPQVEAIFFRDADELNEKIGYYLARPAERREIVASLRATIVERCSLHALYGEMIAAVTS